MRVGWFLFAAGCLLQVLIELDLVELPVSTDDAFGFFPYIYGTLILVVSMSVYLARAVAITNKELAAQLEQVRDLSARAVDHEREVQSAKLSHPHAPGGGHRLRNEQPHRRHPQRP